MSIPRATYRVQLHRGFTFRDARAIVPYLARLGISHLYASPFLKARPGSTHGYDIVDHEALNPEIGSEEDLDQLLAALRAHGMGLMLDVVPNHMGVLKADNRWWLDVLEHGQASRYASFFDIDWAPESTELAGKVLLPILADQYGDVLDRGDIMLRFDAEAGELTLWYFEHRLPVRPATYPHLLVPGIDRLARETREGVATLRRLADAFAAVPVMPTPPGVEDATARSDASKRELAQLCAADPAVTRFIEANVRTVNGVPGEPSSFDALHALIKGQAYRLAFWRVAADDINYRRFFDINDLAAVRAERPEVFEATHRLILRLVASGDADCLRIDHPDGLSDPAAYCARLQGAAAAALGGSRESRAVYLVLEKILAEHERLAQAWPVHGTTGYRFMNVVNGLFVDTRARTHFDRLYAAFIEERLDFDAVLRRSKTLIVVNALAGDLNRLATALTGIAKRDRHTCDYTRNSIRRALVDVVACFPVYRTYATPVSRSEDDRRFVDWAVAVAKRESPDAEHSVFDFVGATLRGDVQPADPEVADAVARFVERFQQFSAPVMAKGMEDTSFYLYNRLASLNEVGGNPRTFGFTVAAFHGASQDRAHNWPHTMLATATHDTKRGEDVRTRIDVLSEIPAVWRLALRRWRQLNRRHRSTVDGVPAPSRNDEYLLYQTLLGAWPPGSVDDAALDAFRERIQAYVLKAVREAKVHTSWVNPYAPYEQALARFVDGLLGRREANRFLQDFLPLAARIARHGCVNSLAQTLVKLTSPGVPDFYQGTELWQLALVDPDNRRPVDYALRERMLDEVREADPAALLESWPTGRVKLWLIARVLALRRERAAWFERAGYVPIATAGTHASRVVAYARSREGRLLVVVVPRLWTALSGESAQWPLGASWSDTCLLLPDAARDWRNVLTGALVSARAEANGTRMMLADALAAFPVALVEPG
ncbi:MAG TPA: malto-oligosyltrehalose synthase [Casimicrobiaceae bacterium]